MTRPDLVVGLGVPAADLDEAIDRAPAAAGVDGGAVGTLAALDRRAAEVRAARGDDGRQVVGHSCTGTFSCISGR